MKQFLSGFFIGAVLACSLVYFSVNTDKAIIKSKKNKKDLELTIKNIQKDDYLILTKQKDELKPIAKRIKAVDKAIAKSKSDDVVLLKRKISLLEQENTLLKHQIGELHFRLDEHNKAHKEALNALNSAQRALYLEKFKGKAVTIGMSVAVPLVITGVVVAMLYTPKVL